MGSLIFCSKNQTHNIIGRDYSCSVAVVVCFRFLETLLTSYFHQSSFLLQKALLVLGYSTTISSSAHRSRLELAFMNVWFFISWSVVIWSLCWGIFWNWGIFWSVCSVLFSCLSSHSKTQNPRAFSSSVTESVASESSSCMIPLLSGP